MSQNAAHSETVGGQRRFTPWPPSQNTETTSSEQVPPPWFLYFDWVLTSYIYNKVCHKSRTNQAGRSRAKDEQIKE